LPSYVTEQRATSNRIDRVCHAPCPLRSGRVRTKRGAAEPEGAVITGDR
jgi:hypothetical protein